MKRVILLDVDGTLVDSNALHAEAWRVALEAYGFSLPYERVLGLIGMGGDKLLPELTGLSKQSARGSELSEHRQQLFMREYVQRAHALPGARAFVERLLEAGHRPVVASSANNEELEALLSRANLSDLLTARTSSDDADRSKPDPDILQAALEQADATPQEALMVGDTPYDLKAAVRAGVPFIGVRSGGYDERALRGALVVYENAEEICRVFEGSPFAADSR
jgi:HAD superfamily hydrolase (TIGR01509 family)